MANVSLSRGVKTRGGCGGTIGGDGFTALENLTGTGFAEWAVDATGAIVPAGSYATKPYVAFTKAAGQTYSLTGASSGRTVDILMVAARADVSWLAADTAAANQLTVLTPLIYNANGALKAGDSVYFRDGMVYNPLGTLGGVGPSTPTNGYAGWGTIVGGSGYTNGTYNVVASSSATGSGAILQVLVSGNTVVQVHVQYPGDNWRPRVGYSSGGYQAGDVLTATIPGGSGFTFTVIDFAATIVFRSETPDTSDDPNYPGEPNRGGGATITAMTIDDRAIYLPFDFQYFDFYWNTNNPYGATATLTLNPSSGTFTVAETVTCNNGCTATVTSWTVGATKTLGLSTIATAPILSATSVTGNTSGATGTITAVSVPTPGLVDYRNNAGWGIGFYRNNCQSGPLVTSAFGATTLRNQTAFETVFGSAFENRSVSIRRLTNGVLNWALPSPLASLGDNWPQTRVDYNWIRDSEGGDANGTSMYNYYFCDNFMCGFIIRSGAHDDSIQFRAPIDGIAHPFIGEFSRNISLRGTLTANQIDAQGIFLKGSATTTKFVLTGVAGSFTVGGTVTADNGATGTVTSWTAGTSTLFLRDVTATIGAAVTLSGAGGSGTISSITPTTNAGVTIKNNIIHLTAANAFYPSQVIGPDVEWNTGLCVQSSGYGAAAALGITLNGYGSSGGVVDRNITNAAVGSTYSTPAETYNPIITNGVLAQYLAAFPNYDSTVNTYDEAITAFTPALNGTTKNADGTYSGALFPDGSFNDGTVYGSTPATYITQVVLDTSIQTGESTTINYQLDATATSAVTITPTKSGTGTGTFSAATVVIGIGTSSGSVDILATGAGTLSVTCTNNRGLANPATSPITITSPVTSPTLYTQVGSPATYAGIGQTITITYTLDAPAVADTTITAAASLAGSFLVGNTVVIPVGQTQGSLTFVPSAAGMLSLTATNNKSLTNPSALVYDTSACNAGQLIMLGIRHA